MNLFHKHVIKKVQIAGMIAGTILGISALVVTPRANAAVTFGGPFNCDTNSVVYCGAKATSDIINAYNNGQPNHRSAATIQNIYSKFGISSADIQSLGTTAVAGTVTKSGDVYVGSQLVATGALTAGRDNMAGSTKVTVNGTTFYTRPPSVSFQQNTLTAFVVMKNGQFQFAILSACGNPIVATAKPATKGTLACTALLATPGAVESNGDQAFDFTANATATNASISKYVFDFGSSNGSQTVTTNAESANSNTQVYTPGSHTITVKVYGSANNSYTAAPATVSCSKSFDVATNGSLTCNSLTMNQVSEDLNTGDVTYTLTANATPGNGVTINKYIFNYGDQSSTTDQVNTSANSATSQSFVYKAGQSYSNIYVTIYGTSGNGNQVTAGGPGSSCETNVSIPAQTCSTGSTSSACSPTCTAPNGQTYPAGSSQCTPSTPTTTSVTTTTPPSQLANTGPGDVIGLFAVVSILGGFGYHFFTSRRLSRGL